MQIIQAAPFSRVRPDFSAFLPVDQNDLWTAFIAIEKVVAQHARRIARRGPATPLRHENAQQAIHIREDHIRPWRVDPVLFGIQQAALLATLAEVEGICPHAYCAAWQFAGAETADVGAMAIYTEIPGPRLVFYWRGLWAEAEANLAKLCLNPVGFAGLVRNAQQIGAPGS